MMLKKQAYKLHKYCVVVTLNNKKADVLSAFLLFCTIDELLIMQL